MPSQPDRTGWEVRGDEDAPAVLLVPPLGRGRASWGSQTPTVTTGLHSHGQGHETTLAQSS
jgi:CO/xanthine dehydrogenase Mo-binding subunit